MSLTQEIWIVEYSPSQDQFHIDTIDSIASNNLRGLLNGKPSKADYNILAVVDSYEEAHRKRAEIRRNM